ncbi:C39 family peptidase [Acinetobacter sp. YT-02]|uniref:C39 family peptidase n=1 Tax=Acinetobacter sp. YT-02 TaxID=2018564 RepID=UPI000BDBD444|nr:C39 family peptidase [Acinetobacter sp. YT-02]PCN59276.1 hypothetical protein CF596_14075 [Acinetobacter sp. YT-02]
MKNFFLILLFFSKFAYSSPIYINNYNYDIKIKSWKEIRDKNIVKQDLDFSCGAASIATLLNGYYNQRTTEQQVLKIMDKGDLIASFDDMQKALNTLGFEAKGYAVSLETLKKLKIPVIAYIKHRKNDHFTVISGINDHFVRVSDPSLGQRILNIHQFKNMWETRSDKHLKGKVLIILPKDESINFNFFTKEITSPTLQSIKFLASQH